METKLIKRNSNNTIELTGDGQKLFNRFEKAYNMMLLTEKDYIQSRSLNTERISIGVSSDIEFNWINNKVKLFKEKYSNIVIKIY